MGLGNWLSIRKSENSRWNIRKRSRIQDFLEANVYIRDYNDGIGIRKYFLDRRITTKNQQTRKEAINLPKLRLRLLFKERHNQIKRQDTDYMQNK